jgi:hypothetical protein
MVVIPGPVEFVMGSPVTKLARRKMRRNTRNESVGRLLSPPKVARSSQRRWGSRAGPRCFPFWRAASIPRLCRSRSRSRANLARPANEQAMPSR